MHLLILSDDYPSEGRPSFVFVQQLVHALVRQGVEVSVVASQSLTHAFIHRQKLLPKEYRVNLDGKYGYKVYRPYSVSFGAHFRCIASFFDWFNQGGLNRVLKKVNPSVVYGHFWHSAVKLSKYAEKYNKPLFVACGEGDNAMEELVSSLSRKDMNRLRHLVRGVICVSTENKRKCVEYNLATSDNIVVLPNCVDDNVFNPGSLEQRERIRSKMGLSNEDFLLLFVGGFIHRKGADRVSRAIDKLGDPHLKSVFVGRAMEGKDSQPSCKGIIYKGIVNHDALPPYYRAADVFCLPTLNEGCCNAIIESLSCGTPVISSDRPFNADILNSGNSILIDPENVDEIAVAISRLMKDKALYESKKEYTMAHSGEYSILARAGKVKSFIQCKMKNYYGNQSR